MKYIRYIHYARIIVVLFQYFSINTFSQSLHFNRLTTTEGLSNNTIHDVIQDRYGFIWLATDDGLNRFDGYQFKVFRNETNNENSLTDNSIRSLKEDSEGRIWIGTKSGWLNCYDPSTDKFTKWQINSNLDKDNPIMCIYEDKNKNIWVGTYKRGVYKLEPKERKVYHWYHGPNDSFSLSHNNVSSIIEDGTGNLWIGTYNGLNKTENPPKKFIRYFSNPKYISHNIIWNLTKSRFNPNMIWIGTMNGINTYNSVSNTFSEFIVPNPDSVQFGNSVVSVIEDIIADEKILWINSYGGLIRINLNRNNINRYLYNKNDPHSIPSNQINRIAKDHSGVLWIATNNGLCYYSAKSNKFNDQLSSKKHHIEVFD